MKKYRKFVALFAVCALLVGVLNPTVATAAVDYSYIRVKLSSIGSPSSLQFKVAGAYRLEYSGASPVNLFQGITYTIQTDGSGMKLTYNNGVSNVSVALPATVSFVQYSNGSTNNFLYLHNPGSGYDWRHYSGDMKFIHPSGTTYLQAINTVYLETYLYGVVAYEMSNDWPIEALKAQAVAARTYACRYIRANASGTYQIVDTSANQVYRGYPFISAGVPAQNVINAVNATSGMVIVTDDPKDLTLADGVYSASNGGWIRTANMRWGSANKYHVFKEDTYDRDNPNSRSFTFIFPVTNDSATMNLLSATERNKVNTMLALIQTKLPAALLAQQGISCDASAITINGISAATPSVVKPDQPADSQEYTQVTVTVNVTANGSAVPAPSIGLTGKGVAIANGDTTPSTDDGTDFGNVVITTGSADSTFAISNAAGTAALTVSGVTVTGANAADFTLGTCPTSVAAGASENFAVTFHPSSLGVKTATVTVSTNDSHYPTYTFAIQGTGAASSPAPPAGGDQLPGPSAEPAETESAGGGGMPAAFTGDVTVNLTYIVQASDRQWNVYGELRTAFSGYDSLLASTNLWNVYGKTSDDGKFLYITTRGFGHGVGLSQRGAQYMAGHEHLAYTDILGFYYNISTGLSSIVKLGTTARTLSEIPGNGTKTWGKVTATTLTVRATTSTRSTTVGTLTKNTIVEILGTLSGGWYKILKNSTGLVGYVNATYVSKTTTGPTPTGSVTPTPTPTATVSSSASGSVTPTATPTPVMGRINATTLTLRYSASTGSTPLYTLEKGDVVMILDAYAAANWYKVRYASYVGYVMVTNGTTVYVEAIGDVPPTATVSPTGTSGGGGYITPSTVTGKVNITSGSLTIRKTPTTNSTTNKYTTTIPSGGSLTVVAVANTTGTTDRKWLKINYGSVTGGYVLAKYVTVAGNSSYRACTVAVDKLNVRSGASTSNSILGYLTSGNTVVCTGTSGTWLIIKTNGVTGYVDSTLVRLSVKS